jgi:hypothetical protein
VRDKFSRSQKSSSSQYLGFLTATPIFWHSFGGSAPLSTDIEAPKAGAREANPGARFNIEANMT